MKCLNTLLILTVAVGMPLAEGRAAQPGTNAPRSRAIDYSDLDLSRPADAAQLFRRIRGAAAYVCRPFESDTLARHLIYRKCVTGAIARAVADVRAPLLTQYVVLADGRILSRTQSDLNR